MYIQNNHVHDNMVHEAAFNQVVYVCIYMQVFMHTYNHVCLHVSLYVSDVYTYTSM